MRVIPPLRLRTTVGLATVPLLLGALAPSAQAGSARQADGRQATPAGGRCDITQVETLTPAPGPPPASIAAGRTVTVPIAVVRGKGTAGELPAAGVQVLVGLTGRDWGAYDQVLTDGSGTATARLAIPKHARGAAELDVEVVRLLVELVCLTVEEHGRVVRAWSRAR